MARRAALAAGVVTGVLVLGAGGYVAADAYDLVPGFLTLEPVPDPPQPFPTIPGAVEAPELEPVLSEADPSAPVPDAAELTALAEAAADHVWMGDSVGIVVADQLTGEVLVDLDGDQPHVPASTAKVATGAAVLSALGPDATLTTSVVQGPGGRLVLVGGGDVMLAAGAGDPEATNGRAGLADLAAEVARQLRLAGVTEVTLGVDDTLFSGPQAAPGWGEDVISLGFVAPVTALAVNIAKTRDEPYPPRHADPSLHAGETLAGLLREQGVVVTGSVGREVAPAGARTVGTVESAPLREVVRYALHTSDNTVTEVLGRMVAVERGLPGSFQGATRAVLAELGRLGLDTDGAALADTSGLADGSLLSPALLVDLVLHAADPQNAALLPAAVDLPVAGWQGTLEDRLGQSPARGLVRAKTGSLPGVTSLAGTVVTPSGRSLVFAVIADDTPPGGQLGPRRVIDTFVQQLAGCGCDLPR
ncbi:D-alanyl-D-alanine carboxypeptidase/D-alanyl-D-alanine-endopeptidase [Actinotalea sp. BY-33]|uniref:D-alanyl-D-alanine carboxypeptidase/D-alanyl-D-alanine-endopeptidase n=1 Tax=Actinotalea soli TaxID=2819234 RepID=A0A939LU11_9CELL|nr:D-alanyl-D-alanine carboxypeptidase/D-alanyl-D-alanine-endopeptidase [Actinotalea soli]MBO1752990.1 D-alanyl-D-alanine carboxypeptidase/D-alanyl-D-alanine-endopeptidase [Actinotalea soli]